MIQKKNRVLKWMNTPGSVILLALVVLLAGCKKDDPAPLVAKASDFKWEKLFDQAGWVSSLSANGNQLILGTYFKGVYVSSDGGNLWSVSDNGILPTDLAGGETTVYSVAMNGSDALVGTSNNFYLSSDKGQSWTSKTNGILNPDVYSIAANGNTIFVVNFNHTSYPDIYRSTDRAVTWTKVNTGLEGRSIFCIAIHGSDVYAGTDTGVYRSTDNGNTWKPINNGMLGKLVSVLVFSGSQIYAGTLGSGVFVSSDQGASWQSAGLTTEYVNVLVISGVNILVGAGPAYGVKGGVFLSTDGGKNWTDVNTGLPTDQITSLLVIGNKVLAGTNGYGLYSSPL